MPAGLPERTLDTLPINIAVIGGDGDIRYTNRAWRDFEGVGGGPEEMVGSNYFAAIDEEGDDVAAEAARGLRSVLEGERDLFNLEYPCHSPTERRWFMLRASRLVDGEDGEVVVAHIDITERKLAELDARDRRRELEHLVSRIEGLLVNVVEGVLQSRTRDDIEAAVCEHIGAVDPYLAAWTGRLDLAAETIEPTESAGLGRPTAAVPLASEDVTVTALEENAVQVAAGAADLGPPHDEIFDRMATAADDQRLSVGGGRGEGPTDPGAGTTGAAAGPAQTDDEVSRAAEGPAAEGCVVALPLVYKDTEYGVLTVYSATPTLDDRELAVLEALARLASTAINAVEGRRLLSSDRVVELELSVADAGLFYHDVAAALACSLEYRGSVEADDGAVSSLFVARGVDPDALVAEATAHPTVEDVTVLSEREGEVVVEFAVAEQPLVEQLARHGAETTAITASDRETRLTVELPADADARAVVEGVTETFPSLELLARTERERADQTRGELVADIEESLTDRQRLALQKAAIGGFFDWPREVSGEELADSMDITPSTYHQHLRRAEQKVMAALFEW